MATTTARRRTAHPMSYYLKMVQDMDNCQKLELITILAESIKPAVKADEAYSLRPFTMEELNTRIDKAEGGASGGSDSAKVTTRAPRGRDCRRKSH